jgi:hypothetical protein
MQENHLLPSTIAPVDSAVSKPHVPKYSIYHSHLQVSLQASRPSWNRIFLSLCLHWPVYYVVITAGKTFRSTSMPSIPYHYFYIIFKFHIVCKTLYGVQSLLRTTVSISSKYFLSASVLYCKY